MLGDVPSNTSGTTKGVEYAKKEKEEEGIYCSVRADSGIHAKRGDANAQQ